MGCSLVQAALNYNRRGLWYRVSYGRRESAFFVAEFEDFFRLLAFGNEGGDGSEEGIEFGWPAGGEVDAEDARVVIPEDQALAGFVTDAQEFAQVAAQGFDAAFGAQESGPNYCPIPSR